MRLMTLVFLMGVCYGGELVEAHYEVDGSVRYHVLKLLNTGAPTSVTLTVYYYNARGERYIERVDIIKNWQTNETVIRRIALSTTKIEEPTTYKIYLTPE